MGTTHTTPAHTTPSSTLRRSSGLWALSLLTALALAACDRGKPGGAATQIAAKVNRQEISVHQVNFALQRQTGLTPDQLDAASRKTLDALVDQELVLQAATEQKIDRDPAVMQSLDAARRELIARAYAERLAASVQAPSEPEIKQYYDAHPALFSRRRLYTLVDTAVDATPEQQKAIRAQLPATRNANDVAAVLRQAGLRHGARQSTVGAEALPMQAVDAMVALREGQSHLIGGPSDAHILTVVSVETVPLSFEQARAPIESFLTGERKRELLQQQIKTLRSAAQIEYRGRFAAQAAAQAPPQQPAVQPAEPTSALKNVSALK
ncbi:EpsD family peptidyl-prolyl cis-trans isomerase [Sphaerotilaceae bacterium SBD11-9]